MSETLERQVQFIQVPAADFSAAVEGSVPEDVAWLLNYLFDTVLDGRNAYVGNGVQSALGREPADFSDFARRIADSGDWSAAKLGDAE